MTSGSSAAEPETLKPLPKLQVPYLLVLNIPVYQDSNSVLLVDALWLKDLREHLCYIDNFTLASPRSKKRPPKDAMALEFDSAVGKFNYVGLPAPTNRLSALIMLPVTLFTLWRAVSRAVVVHSAVAGWPLPLGWFVTPIARLLRKKYLIIVESAPWRLQPGLPKTIIATAAAFFYERLARWCLARTDLAIFTHDEYRRSLMPNQQKKCHVIQATWIDEDGILSEEFATQLWRRKTHGDAKRPIRLIFVGRLEVTKGVSILLEAINLVATENLELSLDILGEGVLARDCLEVAANLKGSTRVNVLGTVTYGAPFFELLRIYHAVIVPSISDEQPRVVYDAYSQAIPALATRTAGLSECVIDNQTGWLTQPNSARALATLMHRSADSPTELANMGMRALTLARTKTHQQMHRTRLQLLQALAK